MAQVQKSKGSDLLNNPAPVASLPLQCVIAFDQGYQNAYFLLTLLGLFYKAYAFNYVASYFVAELLGLLLLWALQHIRLHMGSKGNKNETSGAVVLFCGLSVLTIGGSLFYITSQTYVMIFDLVLGGLSVLCGLFEMVVGFVCAIKYHSLENSR